jgi:pyruvate kinase
VANAILDGTDAVMLSQETAIGEYPAQAVAMMAAVARFTEKSAPYERWNTERVRRDARDPGYTVAHSVVEAARELALDAIIVPTLSGRSARLVSANRPNVPIYALSPGRETVRRVEELGWCHKGQRIAVTAGLPSGRPGTTSLLQIQEV